MCIARVGRVLALSGRRARVQFFDGGVSGSVDVSLVETRKGAYVEVFGNLALSKLSRAEAARRRIAWESVSRAG